MHDSQSYCFNCGANLQHPVLSNSTRGQTYPSSSTISVFPWIEFRQFGGTTSVSVALRDSSRQTSGCCRVYTTSSKSLDSETPCEWNFEYFFWIFCPIIVGDGRQRLHSRINWPRSRLMKGRISLPAQCDDATVATELHATYSNCLSRNNNPYQLAISWRKTLFD